ncbi:MAG: hypothetical protein HYV97_11985 [Bdellovibrio sp.]|nr:hypothetical protein [Bdellovibrio sp.]
MKSSILRALHATLLIITLWCVNLVGIRPAMAQGGWPTPPPGATIPPGIPTIPPGATIPPGIPTSIPTIPSGSMTCVPDTGPVACANGVTQKQLADVRALLAGESQSVIEAKVQEICNDPAIKPEQLACLMNPVLLPPELQPPSQVELPESLQRRLIMNNQVSKITPDQWPAMAKDFSNGIVPEGFDPYFPEEREALKALGFSDEDLKKLPPAGDRLNEVLDEYANEQYDNVKGMATGYAGGYLFGVAMVTLYAVFGALPMFLRCKSMPSAIIFFVSSMVYIVKLLAMIKTYIDFVDDIVATMESKPAEQLKAGIDEYKRAINQGKAFARDGEAMVGRGEDLYQSCKDMGYDAGQIASCVNTANQFGVDAQTLKNRGVEWLNCEMARVKTAAADQFAMINHAYEVIKQLKTIVLAEAISTTIVAAAWGVASGFAIAETVNPTTGFGSCVASNEAPIKSKKQMLVEYFKDLFTIQQAFAGKENAEQEFKEAGFNWLFVILMAAGVWLVTTTAVITSSVTGTNAGTMRAIFITAAALQAIVGMGFLWSAFSYTSDLVDQMAIFIRALRRTLSNEGVNLAGGDWTKAEEHLGVKDMKEEDREKFDPCTKLALDNNPDRTATPIPTPPGGWPTIPPGATIPPGWPTPPGGIPTPPSGTFKWPPMELDKESVSPRRNLFSEAWHKIVKQVMGQELMSSALAQTPRKRSTGYCISNNKFQPDYGCDCRQAGTCFTPQTLNLKLDKRIDPRGMKNHASLYKDMNKAIILLSQDRMNEAQRLTRNFPQRIDGLKKEQAYLNNVLNSSLASKKKAPVNIGHEAKNMQQAMLHAFQKKANSLPAKDRERVLGFMGGASTPPKATEQAVAKKDNMISKGIRSLKRFLDSLGPLGKKRYPSQAARKRASDENLFEDVASSNIDWSDAGVVDDEANATEPGTKQLEDYEISESEIIQDGSVSIFKVITNRYLKKFMSGD